jgi:hypothetical protein
MFIILSFFFRLLNKGVVPDLDEFTSSRSFSGRVERLKFFDQPFVFAFLSICLLFVATWPAFATAWILFDLSDREVKIPDSNICRGKQDGNQNNRDPFP